MNTAETVTAYIASHGVSTDPAAYNVQAAAVMLDKWAAEDGIPVTAISAEEVAACVESHRRGVAV